MSRIAFTVLGDPQPQGSKTIVQRHGKRPVMREDNPLTEPWRATVAKAAQAVMAGEQLRTGPLRVTATFVFRRPAGHWGTGRNASRLKRSAPLYVQTRPDVDKLLRAIGDAITGIVCRDDAQLVIVRAEKHYGEPSCVHVLVEELELGEALVGDSPPDALGTSGA